MVTLAIGILVGLNWTNFASTFLPYLGIKSKVTNDWSALDEVYSTLVNNYDGEVSREEVIEGAKRESLPPSAMSILPT